MKNRYQFIEAKLTITSVKIVPGFVHSSTHFNDKKYGQSMFQGRKTEAIALLVNFVDESGKEGKFYSPSTEISIADGLVNYRSLKKESVWFVENVLDKGVAYGAKMFDNGNTPNCAIWTKSEIVPSIEVGDSIKISFSLNEKGYMKRVKLLEIFK